MAQRSAGAIALPPPAKGSACRPKGEQLQDAG